MALKGLQQQADISKALPLEQIKNKKTAVTPVFEPGQDHFKVQ